MLALSKLHLRMSTKLDASQLIKCDVTFNSLVHAVTEAMLHRAVDIELEAKNNVSLFSLQEDYDKTYRNIDYLVRYVDNYDYTSQPDISATFNHNMLYKVNIILSRIFYNQCFIMYIVTKIINNFVSKVYI